jgi:hypothetical protein
MEAAIAELQKLVLEANQIAASRALMAIDSQLCHSPRPAEPSR